MVQVLLHRRRYLRHLTISEHISSSIAHCIRNYQKSPDVSRHNEARESTAHKSCNDDPLKNSKNKFKKIWIILLKICNYYYTNKYVGL